MGRGKARATSRGVSLRMKLYVVATALMVLAFALVTGAAVPLITTGNRAEAVRNDVTSALAAEAFARQLGQWSWHLHTLVATSDHHHVMLLTEARDSALVAVDKWIAHDSDDRDVAAAQNMKTVFLELDAAAGDIIDATTRGDASAARDLLVEDFSLRLGEDLGIPLDGLLGREHKDLREAFIQLTASAASTGPLATAYLRDDTLTVSQSAEVAIAASKFARFQLLNGQLTALMMLEAPNIEPDFISIMMQLSGNELESLALLIDERNSADLDATLEAITGSNAELGDVTHAIGGDVAAGDLQAAHTRFAHDFHDTLDGQATALDDLVAAQHARVMAGTADIVSRGRTVALATTGIAAALFVLGLVAAQIARRTARRIAQTSAAVNRLAEGDLSARIPSAGSDELSHLGHTFNRMAKGFSESRRREQRFLKGTVAAAESERMQLAADLHDGPVQRLTGVLYALERLKMRSDRGQHEGMAELLGSLRGDVSEEIARLRRILTELRPPALEERGLEPALRDYTSEFARREHVECAVDINIDGRVSEALETTMYRVVQEALTNVGKHAQASHVDVRLLGQDGRVRLLVADDGVGFNPESGNGDPSGERFGLMGMSERVRLAGGKFAIKAAPGAGTKVMATFRRDRRA